jgi:hypothetical protein
MRTPAIVDFAVNLLVGGVAFYASARFLVYRDRYGHGDVGHAVLTAVLGALAWAIPSQIPLVGTLLAFVGWLAVVRFRYPGGWLKTVTLAAAAWAVAVLLAALLALVGLGPVSAVGVPGV